MKDTQIIKNNLKTQLKSGIQIISVTHGKGSVRHWIYVRVGYKPTGDWKKDRQTEIKLYGQVEKIVEKSDVILAQYPDEITDQHHNCVNITILQIINTPEEQKQLDHACEMGVEGV